ncbi:hypothetical protein JRQ81_019954 [Phrynocephalus forsythii]|uniref:Ribosomal RNA-processing protein 8 n=1 Tax=Phrynocephalus forsythii TaxID=171643 RepID=A0A9Q0XNL4_9SAUR|nr:hypothetical protein JRQ81_019954 [Phrynocephalus forsythii]
MFEEGEWAPEAGPASPLLPPRRHRPRPPGGAPPGNPPAADPPWPPVAGRGPRGGSRGLSARPGPSEGERRRRLLLATLRRLREEEEWGGPPAELPPAAAAARGGQGVGEGAVEPGAEEPEGSPRPRSKRPRAPQEEPPASPAPKQAPTGTPGRGPGETESSGATSRSKQGSHGATETVLTRRQWKNRQKNKRRQRNKFKAGGGVGLDVGGIGGDQALVGGPKEEPAGDQGGGNPLASAATELPSSRAASLRRRLEERLVSARFRYINEQLYTSSSQEAARLFKDDPEALAAYHRGFARQVARWPENPVQRFVRYLRNRYGGSGEPSLSCDVVGIVCVCVCVKGVESMCQSRWLSWPLASHPLLFPRPPSLVVADFGCGDCTLARSLRNKVHCFDLVALDPRVTVCDMAQVPLETESVDVAVFCLALMGTNLREILEEANRVLRVGGTLLVAEVASRFPDVRAFVGALAQLGFRLLAKDVSGSHFFAFEFRKEEEEAAAAAKGKALPGLALRPCLYKRR